MVAGPTPGVPERSSQRSRLSTDAGYVLQPILLRSRDPIMAITVTFLGAAKNVTGSRHLVQAGDTRILIDCGMYQERHNAAKNWDPFAVSPRSIDAVVLTHGHLDHAGWLPRFAHDGFQGTTYCSPATSEVVPVVLADSARLQSEDAAWKRKRHAAEGRQSVHPVVPLYDDHDVDLACKTLRPIPFGEPHDVAPGFSATLLPAGHILGAGMVLLEHEDSGKSLLFSGDLGRPGRPLVPNPTRPPKADLVVVESTYGDRIHDDSVDVPTQLADAINTTLGRSGWLLIPCFAVERAQELLYHLKNLRNEQRIPRVPIYLDSPMAVRVLEIFGHHPEAMDLASQGRIANGDSPFDLPELQLCSTRAQSKYINEDRRPAIIIAGSGMCTGGRIKHHLLRHLDNPQCTLLFVGYQATGTLGREILDGSRHIRLFGSGHRVRLDVQQIRGLSGHCGQDELLDWLGAMPEGPKKVAVVHGGANVTTLFGDLVSERFGCEVVVPEYRESVRV